MPPTISFDVIGTCFAFESVISTIQTRLGASLASVDPTTLFFSWFYAAQRDFTYLSLASSYTPIASVLAGTFRRACATVDLDPSNISDDDITAIMAAFKSMPGRPGLKSCFDGLKAGGWEVFAVTNGGLETSEGYFANEGIGWMKGAGRVVSCDGIRVAKPDLRVYENAIRVVGEKVGAGDGTDGRGSAERWFVAAHAWDLIAARKAGYKTAYLTFEERDGCEGLFGRFDLVADSMEELLGKMKELS